MTFSKADVPAQDTITVSAFCTEEVDATHGDVSISIRGASLISGNSALTKAREVAALVAELKQVGISEANIELRNVHAEVSTGTLGNKVSSATYTLSIVKVLLAQIADVVGAVTSQKTAVLNAIAWRYEDPEAAALRLLEAALLQAQNKARLTSRTLGVELLGINSLEEKWEDSEPGPTSMDYLEQGSTMARARRPAVNTEELGLAVTHRKRITQRVQVSFRVSPIANS